MQLQRTIRTRTRWWCAAAAALMALTATAVPAGAANTAAERLVDHDERASTAPVRAFAGADRYATAVLLAETAAQLTGISDTVIVASGQSEVDAVAAAGLAAALEAPIVLTRRDTLPRVTARFLGDHDPTRVLILGGPAAVSDTVVQRIEALAGRPDVERIAGADRYATAVAIADEIGGAAAEWCGAHGNTVLLAGGHAIAEAVAAGPLAYAHASPVLLTERDELSEATAEWIADADVDRVIIVGGTDSVGTGVELRDLFDIGVGEVRRISGRGPVETSVELVRELTSGGCADIFAADTDTVGLVKLASPSDGLSAAPVFGYGLDAEPIGILLVTDELPAAVRDYLAGTPRYDESLAPTHLEIVAVGGTAAITPEVMDAAVDAAGVAPPLVAKISAAKAGDTSFTVTFTDDIDAEAVGARSLLRINGVPRVDVTVTVTRPRQITVRFAAGAELAAGDIITVVDGRRVGTAGDTRPLVGDTYTVPDAGSDRVGPAPVPQVTVAAVTGATQFAVLVSNSILAPGSAIEADEITVEGPDSTPIGIQPDLTEYHNTLLRHRYAWVVTVDEPLPDGAVIRVAHRAVTDEGGRYRNSREHVVVRDAPDLRVNRVTVSDPVSTTEGVAFITASTTSLSVEPIIQLRSLAEGDAAGAASAQWRVDTWLDLAEPDGDILVAADPRHHVVSITVGPRVSIRSLVAEIAATPVISDRFEVWMPSNTIAHAQNEVISAVGQASDSTHGATRFTAGRSKVEIQVLFNTAAASLADDGAQLLEALLGSRRESSDATTCSVVTTRWDCFGAAVGETSAADVAMRFVPGNSLVDIWVETASVSLLPKMRDPVSISAAVAEGWPEGNTSDRYARVLVPGNATSTHGISHDAWD